MYAEIILNKDLMNYIKHFDEQSHLRDVEKKN